MYLSKCVCQIVFVKMIIIMIASYMTIYDAANFLTNEWTDGRTDGRTDKAFLGVGYEHLMNRSDIVHFYSGVISIQYNLTNANPKIFRKSENFPKIRKVSENRKIFRKSENFPKI